jgi:hypothetical protein
MLRRSFVSKVRTSHVVTAALAIGGGATVYTHWDTSAAASLQRQATFWMRVAPVIADYYYITLKMKHWQKDAAARGQVLRLRHEKHSSTMLNVMLELKGLYIKLGVSKRYSVCVCVCVCVFVCGSIYDCWRGR